MGSSKVLKRLGLWGSVSSIAFMETDISPLPPPTPVSARVQFGDGFWAPQPLGTLGTTISPPRRLQKDEGLPCVEKELSVKGKHALYPLHGLLTKLRASAPCSRGGQRLGMLTRWP